MRFPESKIKEAILNPAPEIRERATYYFAKSYSDDVSIMPLVIQAVQTHGRQRAYRLIGPARDLAQTAESIAWVIDELSGEFDFVAQEAREFLLETCTLTGERFPEFDQWSAERAAEKEQHEKTIKEIDGDPHRLMLYAVAKLAGKNLAGLPLAKPASPAIARSTPALLRAAPARPALLSEPARKPRVGRNDPCRCGSTKKYKKCCGRNL